jgi:hypothetical protein
LLDAIGRLLSGAGAGEVRGRIVSEADNYRTLSQMDLRRVFTSLGLPRSAFRDPHTTPERPCFDAVLNADSLMPGRMWLFKGSDYFLYNLVSGEIEEGPKRIADWGGGTLPELFKTGIHAALWAGPVAPHRWVFFKDEWWVTMDSSQGFVPVEGPAGVLGHWASGAWTDAAGSFTTPGTPAALHGLGSEFDGKAHFFKDGHYIRHNLRNGATDCPLMPVADAWRLPEPFLTKIDLAFYGTGPAAENIYFLSGEQFVLYDFRTEEVLAAGLIEERFPAFAQFLGRPQLFLVEDYSLTTFVGPPHLGRLIDTRSIGAGSSITRILVTETTDTSVDTIKQSLLDSQDSSVVNSFYDHLDRSTSESGGSEQYKYQLNASAHGDASATGIWGGEVNAQLHVAGDTDTRRHALSEATFDSIRKQVDESKRNTVQKTYNSELEISTSVHVLRKEVFQESNTSDQVRVYQFFEQLEPYITLLALQSVRLAFSSDATQPPRIVDLSQTSGLLSDVLVDEALQHQVIEFLRSELSNIADYLGAPGSILVEGGAQLAVKPRLSSTYDVVKADGTTQTVAVRGYAKADRTWVEPTFTITCVQV